MGCRNLLGKFVSMVMMMYHLNASFTASWTNKIGQESGQAKHVLSKNCKQCRVKVLKLS